MALKCGVRDLGVQRIISTPIEHHCVLHSIDRVLKTDGVSTDFLKVDTEGKINLKELESLLTKYQSEIVMVSIMHANNEIGTLQDIAAISALCEKYNAFFHSDTVQTVAHYPIDVNQHPIHFMSGSAHKFHGPKGVGFIYMNQNAILEPFIDGGAQERNMRAGTENVSGIVGMAKALEMAQERSTEDQNHILSLKNQLKKGLLAYNSNISFNGPEDDSECLSTVLNAQFPPHPKNDMFLMYLDLKGIAVSGGSACSSGANQGSHVIRKVREEDPGMAVRFSFSRYNSAEEIDSTLNCIEEILS
jgi:cysteine desulfurase